MSFATRTLQSATGFTPVTRTYTSGSGTETVPVGATRLVITNQGGGAGGYFNLQTSLGGGAGGEGVKTIAVIGGNTLLFAVGAGSAANTNFPGSNSSVTGTVAGGAVNMVAKGGGAAGQGGGAGGTSSGGDTNTTGGNASSGTGGSSPYGPGFGNGGNSFSAGQGGIITFAYT